MMHPDAATLELLFATVATIIATLTGLIGAFSTFRLQQIFSEIQLLKDLLLDKNLPADKKFKDYVKGEHYYLLEKIYDTTDESIATMQQLVLDNKLETALNELLIDIDNIRRSHLRHDMLRKMAIKYFIRALLFVFASIVLLVFTNHLLQWQQPVIWAALLLYFVGVAYIFYQFVQQLKQLV